VILMLLVRVFDGIREHFPVRAIEWLFAIILFNWGLTLVMPHEVFAAHPAFAMMATIASEMDWGIGAMVVGGLRFVALVLNGTFADKWYARYSPHVRAGLAGLSCFFWMQIALSLLASDGPSGTGLAVYPAILWFEVFCAFRAARDAGQVDEAARNARRR